MEQVNTTPTPAPVPTPTQAPNVIVVQAAPPQQAESEAKWFKSRQLQAAFITGAVSFVVNIVNIWLTKTR